MEIVLKRGKLNWLVRDNSIIAFDKIQATIYAPYISAPDNKFLLMRNKIIDSKESEYGDWCEAISLACECKMFGQGTRIPRLDMKNKID